MTSEINSMSIYEINRSMTYDQLMDAGTKLLEENNKLRSKLIEISKGEYKHDDNLQIDLINIDIADLRDLYKEQLKINKELNDKIKLQGIEITNLKKEHKILFKECKDLREDNKNLREDNKSIHKENKELREDNKILNKKLDNIQNQLDSNYYSVISGELIAKYMTMITENIIGEPSDKKLVDIIKKNIKLTPEQQKRYETIEEKLPLKINEFMRKLCQIKKPRNDDFHDVCEDMNLDKIKDIVNEYIKLRHNDNKEYHMLIEYITKEIEKQYGYTPFKVFDF